jgi:6-phosphofructokinase
MSAVKPISEHGINCIGVPKTIDCDLFGSDITVGFQTAVETGTEALDRLRTTASSHHRIMVVELMGRHAGWITLHAGIAAGAACILIPEIEFDIETICKRCLARTTQGDGATIIAVAEGARPSGGHQIVERVVEDSPDPIRLGGVAKVSSKHHLLR